MMRYLRVIAVSLVVCQPVCAPDQTKGALPNDDAAVREMRMRW